MLMKEHSKQWGDSRGSAATESKVLAGEKLTVGIKDWLDSCDVPVKVQCKLVL